MNLVEASGASKPQNWVVSGPACRLRCRPTALAPPNRLLRKLLAAEGRPRAARRQAHNPPGLRPLDRARPPTRIRRHRDAASHRAHYAGAADPDRTPAPAVHQIGVQTQGLPRLLLSLHYPNQRDCKPRPLHRRQSLGGAATGQRRLSIATRGTSVGLETSRLDGMTAIERALPAWEAREPISRV